MPAKTPAAEPAKTAEPAKDPNAPPAAALPFAITDLTVPEGFTIDPGLGTELIQTITSNASDPKALANALIALQVKAQSQASETASKGWDTTMADWKKASEADPAIGGANYAKNTAFATELVTRFGNGGKLQEALELTGLGNHPEWLRFTTMIAPFLKEGAPLPAGAPNPPKGGRTTTNLYPDQK